MTEQRDQLDARFHTTRWTLIAAAGADDDGSRRALAELCERYWLPLYAYLRRRGHAEAEAQDLTQGFFAFLLERGGLAAADRGRGRFRSFLLASLNNYVINEWDRERALKRGGDSERLALDFESAEQRYRVQSAGEASPEELFDRHWATMQLERVLRRLKDEAIGAGTKERFLALKGYLIGDDAGPSYREAGDRLRMSESAVKVAVHRLRRRFGVLLREEVAETLADPTRVDEEIRNLFAAF